MSNILPVELWLHVLEHVDPQDLISICMICRDFRELTRGHLDALHALKDGVAESHFSLPMELLDVPNMTTRKLKALALSACGQSSIWDDSKSVISCTQTIGRGSTGVESLVLLPGGGYMVEVFDSDPPQLRKVGSTPIHGYHLGCRRQAFHIFCSPENEIRVLILRNYEVSVYSVDLGGPSLRLLAKFDANQRRILYATANGSLVVFGSQIRNGPLPMFHLRVIPSQPPPGGIVQQIGCNAQFPWLSGSDITILDTLHILVSTRASLLLWEIPPLTFNCDLQTISDWIGFRRLIDPFEGSPSKFPILTSPAPWPPQVNMDSRFGPVHVFDGHVLCTLEPWRSTEDWNLTRYTLPGTSSDGPAARPAVVAAALGRRSFLWIDPPAPYDNDEEIVIQVATLPPAAHDRQDATQFHSEFHDVLKPMRIHVHSQAGEGVLDLAFDEWTGRICLLLESTSGAKRGIFVDIA